MSTGQLWSPNVFAAFPHMASRIHGRYHVEFQLVPCIGIHYILFQVTPASGELLCFGPVTVSNKTLSWPLSVP